MKVIEMTNLIGLGGVGIGATVVIGTMLGHRHRDVFKTDGSATGWHWLDTGLPCPHEVWMAWEAHKARNMAKGLPDYTVTWPKPTEQNGVKRG